MNENNQEEYIYQAKMHTIVFLGPILLILLSALAQVFFPEIVMIERFLEIVGLGWLVGVWFNYYFSILIIKKNRIILQTGWLVRQTMDIPLGKIESIDIRQNIIGSILNYGDLLIIGTGGSKAIMPNLNRPLTCRRHIEHLMTYKE